MHSLKAVSLIILLLLIEDSPAFASMDWKCEYQSRGHLGASTTLFSQSGDILSGVLDEYSGQKKHFKILEDSISGLVAVVSDKSTVTDPVSFKVHLTVIVLNKRTGGFEMTGYVIGTGYEDDYLGKCVKNN